MVDLAIAANFVRELTEEQFAVQRRHASRGAAATRSVNASDAARESGRSEPTPRSRTRNEMTGLRRALARFAQVRG
jgi:hypothetical protein